jgi:hypothetical protein
MTIIRGRLYATARFIGYGLILGLRADNTTMAYSGKKEHKLEITCFSAFL